METPTKEKTPQCPYCTIVLAPGQTEHCKKEDIQKKIKLMCCICDRKIDNGTVGPFRRFLLRGNWCERCVPKTGYQSSDKNAAKEKRYSNGKVKDKGKTYADYVREAGLKIAPIEEVEEELLSEDLSN